MGHHPADYAALASVHLFPMARLRFGTGTDAAKLLSLITTGALE